MTVSAVFKRCAPGLLAIIMLAGLGACAYGPYHPAPAARVPAPYYDYYYYPHADVYFDIQMGYYYYRRDSAWLQVRYLPRHIYLDPTYRVALRLDYDRPYVRHDHHHTTYYPRFSYKPIKEKERTIRNREERNHNFRRHEEYLKKSGKFMR